MLESKEDSNDVLLFCFRMTESILNLLEFELLLHRQLNYRSWETKVLVLDW